MFQYNKKMLQRHEVWIELTTVFDRGIYQLFDNQLAEVDQVCSFDLRRITFYKQINKKMEIVLLDLQVDLHFKRQPNYYPIKIVYTAQIVDKLYKSDVAIFTWENCLDV